MKQFYCRYCTFQFDDLKTFLFTLTKVLLEERGEAVKVLADKADQRDVGANFQLDPQFVSVESR